MDSLQPHDVMQLNAAEGWLELGNATEANEELKKVAPKLRSHPDVLKLQLEIYFKSKEWDACIEITAALMKLGNKLLSVFIKRSFALHKLKRTQEAFDLLSPAAHMFPSWLVRYNLACYCAQLGKLDEAHKWYKFALGINEEAVKSIAFDDHDLKPLWAITKIH